jgi:hypothetical protein
VIAAQHLDYWRMDPKREFYLLRNLQDDATQNVKPAVAPDPVIVIRRVTEVIAVGLAMAKALGWNDPEAVRLGFVFRWTTLKGRRLESWADPFSPLGGGTARDGETTSFVEIGVDTPVAALAPVVNQATAALFSRFNGATISPQLIEDLVRRVLERR